MSTLLQDLRYGLRLLRREPGFAAVAIVTMALGIGAATTLFSVTYGVLMKPLPWPDADRLVRITETRKGAEPRVRGTMSNGPYRVWAGDHSNIEDIGGWLNQGATTLAVDGGEPSPLQTTAVTPSLWRVLKVQPLLGRAFADDDVPEGPVTNRFAILSYGLWQERFGGREDVIGRTVRINDKPVTIVGVMPKAFAFPDRETRAWTPWKPMAVNLPNGNIAMTIFQALARLRPGVTPEQAGAEGTARARSAPDPGMTAVAMFGGNGPAEIRATPAVEWMTAEVRPALLVLLAAVGLLLVSATANVASLQLARATTRRREIAIRAAIGAGTSRLAGQLVAESVVAAVLGGVAGVVLTVALHRALPSLLPADFPRQDAVGVDWRVLLFAVAASIGPGIICGLLPAWHARRVDLIASLSEGGREVGGWRSGTARARTSIMAGQLAVSCVLLVGAALLVRSFSALLHADRGYDPANLLTARVSLPNEYSLERRTAFLERVVERLRAQPGTTDVAYSNALPLVSSGGFRGFKLRPPLRPDVEVEANVMTRVVSPSYFKALGLRLTAGRAIAESDVQTSANVIVVNRSFADKYLGASPVGTAVPNLGMCRGSGDRWQVVGVVDDMRQGSVSDPPQGEVFIPARQIGSGCASTLNQPFFVVRGAGNPSQYAAALRSAVHAEAPTLAPDAIMTMEDRVIRALARPRLYAFVLATFAGFTLAIAAGGLFGVLSYSVAQRSREIGVRTALGARTRDIVTLVVRQALVIAAGGLVAGMVLSAAAARSLSAFLYGVRAYDTLTFVGVPVLLALVALVACVVPARRAARVDPLDVLRAN